LLAAVNFKQMALTKTLKKLKFKYIPQEGCDAWSKIYPGFILFIAQTPNGKLLASLTVLGLEVCLPNIPDEYWVIEFDRQNTAVTTEV
jgi:hypothetical protein